MEKVNYNAVMRRQIDATEGARPTLLLQCCCGPCATAVIERLAPHFALTLYYYNPNTWPEAEYVKRLDTLTDYISRAGLGLDVIAAEYRPNEYFDAVKDVSDTAEGGKRCAACIGLRLEKTAEYAKNHGFAYFASTLSVSPMKNADTINGLGAALEKKYGVKYLFNDFKKEDGYKRSVELSHSFDMYRQHYCGCEASKKKI